MLLIDSREKKNVIDKKILPYFNRNGIEYQFKALSVGDYMLDDNPHIVVDRKHNLSEVATNLSDPDRRRFINELERAKKTGTKIVFLIEHSSNFTSMSDVIGWKNPRCVDHPLALSGPLMFKKMVAISSAYDIEFQFCSKSQTGKRIMEILEGEKNA